jgi:hypothetical protein
MHDEPLRSNDADQASRLTWAWLYYAGEKAQGW